MAAAPKCHGYNTCYAYAKKRWQACVVCGSEDYKNAVAPNGDYLCGRCWPSQVRGHCRCAEALRLIQEHGGDPNGSGGGGGSSGGGSASGGSGGNVGAEGGQGGNGGSYYGGKGGKGGVATPLVLLERRVQLLEDRLRLLESRFP